VPNETVGKPHRFGNRGRIVGRVESNGTVEAGKEPFVLVPRLEREGHLSADDCGRREDGVEAVEPTAPTVPEFAQRWAALAEHGCRLERLAERPGFEAAHA
jgi:hypothetical protein